jgi:type I restriction enzyme S subunit
MSEEDTRLNEFSDADSDKSDGSQRLENKIDIIKGTKPDEVLDEPSDGAEKYLVVDTLTGENEKYAIDESAPSAKPRDTIMIMDGSKSGRVYSGESGILGSTMASLRPDGINPTFLYHFLRRNFNRINSATKGSAVPHTDKDLVRSLEYEITSLSEQRKIATVLHTVDQAIQKTEEIIGQIRMVKTGIQQELFTEGYYDHNSFVETRVGILPESWRLEKIKNYTELVSGAHVKSDLVSNDSSLTPYLTGPDDFDELGFTVTKYTGEPTKFCEAGDTLVTVKGSGCGKSTFANQRACISRQLKALRPNDELEELYLFYFIETKQKLLENLAEGSAIPGLSNSHLTALDIPVPSTKEQHKIAETLKIYDNRIVQEKKYRSQLHRLKRGLMQDLLSGEVRTTDANIEIPEEVAKYG